MGKHIILLGWLYIVLSALGLLIALIVFTAVVGGGLISGDREAIAITSIVGSVVSGFLVLLSVPGIIAGIGLLKFRPWARMLALVLGILNLFNFPLGTALGVYTIWALLNDESTVVFEATARTSMQGGVG
jgi:hypothetical protein